MYIQQYIPTLKLLGNVHPQFLENTNIFID